MLKGFRDFILRGNVIELATAVIIGTAFGAIVTAFTTHIVNPLIAAIPISTDMGGLGFQVRPGVTVNGKPDGDPATFLDFGAVITAMINFVIIAAVVYFLIIVPYNKLTELRKLDEDAAEDEVALLTDIRDILDPEAKARKAEEAAAAKAAEAAKAQAVAAPAVPQQPQQPQYPAGATQQVNIPPQAQQGHPQAQAPAGPPSGGFPTPNPAPGEYPPPGNLPPGQYAPGQYPPPNQGGQLPPDGPRHSR